MLVCIVDCLPGSRRRYKASGRGGDVIGFIAQPAKPLQRIRHLLKVGIGSVHEAEAHEGMDARRSRDGKAPAFQGGSSFKEEGIVSSTGSRPPMSFGRAVRQV